VIHNHPITSDGSGPSWVASIVNEIGRSPYWKTTAILIVWDDWGGWYDHVKPPMDANYGYHEYGFRAATRRLALHTQRLCLTEAA
jgi:phospholipase C